MKKRILISNFHLKYKQGSELYTLEICSSLKNFGYDVGVFTFVPGVISEKIKKLGITIFTPHDKRSIELFDPDIVHIHHLPCLYFLSSLNLDSSFIYSMLGPSSPYASPPSRVVGISEFFAVSEEVKAAAEQSLPLESKISIFRNWFDDSDPIFKKKTESQPTRHLKKIAVVTNHLAPDLSEYLEYLKTNDPSFSWEHLGLPNNSVDITPETLLSFDAIITIGRTVLLAAALGIPVFIHDIHGSDGWLTSENVEKIAQRNFSGRTYAEKLSFNDWKNKFLNTFEEKNIDALALKIRQEFGLSQRVKELQAIYDRLEKVPDEIVLQRIAAHKNEARIFEVLADQVFQLSLHAENLTLLVENLSMAKELNQKLAKRNILLMEWLKKIFKKII